MTCLSLNYFVNKCVLKGLTEYGQPLTKFRSSPGGCIVVNNHFEGEFGAAENRIYKRPSVKTTSLQAILSGTAPSLPQCEVLTSEYCLIDCEKEDYNK
jgi:hypothetical protein